MTQRAYALYVQATTPEGRRRQWLVFPPTTGSLNEHSLGVPEATTALVMTRAQSGPEHRATWARHHVNSDQSGVEYMGYALAACTQDGDDYTFSPVLVVGLTVRDLRGVLTHEKEAHHDVLRRVGRRASRRHGLVI